MALLVLDFSYHSGSLFIMNRKKEILGHKASPSLSLLSTQIQELIDFSPIPIEAIALPFGPGAFTPLRLTAASAFALSLSRNLPLLPYSSFLGLVPETTPISLSLDARSKSAFVTTATRLENGEILFTPISIEPIQNAPISMPDYETNLNQLMHNLLPLWEKKAFMQPKEFNLHYVKQPT